MAKQDIFIQGEFVSVSPITYTAPDIKGLPRIDGRPYIPASAIRGKLRRAARDEILAATGFRPGFHDFFFLTLGGLNTGNGEKRKEDEEEEVAGEGTEAAKESYAIYYIRAAEEINPLVSLFGAGPGSPTAIPSKFFCGHAIAAASAKDSVSSVAPCRTDDNRINAIHTHEMVSDEFFDEYLRHVTMQRGKSDLKSEIADLKRGLRSAEKERADEIRKKINQLQKEIDGMKIVSISNPALAYEVINPGVAMPFSARVIGCTDAELALLVKAIARFSYDPVFGARKAAGNGVVKGTFSFSARPHRATMRPQDIGVLAFEGDFCGPSASSGCIREMLDAPLPVEGVNLSYSEILRKGKAL